MSKKTSLQEHHKRLLKSALSNNYDDILKGQKMKETKVKKGGIDFKKFGIAFAALAIIAGGALGLTLRNGEITAKQAFAQAQEYYENASSQGRYLYQKAILKTEDAPAFTQNLQLSAEYTSEITIERWTDTTNNNERMKVTNSNGQVLDETLELDGKHYSSTSSVFNELGPDAEEIEAIDAFYEDSDESGFPNAYKQIGINSYDELEAADLSPAEEDKLFAEAGLTEPNSFMKDLPVDPSGIDIYNTKPSEQEALFKEQFGANYPGSSDFDPQVQYEQCKAGEESYRKTAKLDKIIENEVNSSEYAAIFEELSNDEFFVVEEVERNGKAVFSISYDRSTGVVGEDEFEEVVFLNKDTYSLAGLEADYGEFGGTFSMTIIEEAYSNNPIDLSTEGLETSGFSSSSNDPAEFLEEQREELEAQGLDVDELIAEAQQLNDVVPGEVDSPESGFGCELILEGDPLEDPFFPEFDPTIDEVRAQ